MQDSKSADKHAKGGVAVRRRSLGWNIGTVLCVIAAARYSIVYIIGKEEKK